MGRRTVLLVIVAVALALTPVVLGAVRYEQRSSDGAVRLLLVRGQGLGRHAASVAAAWGASAREAGLPFAWISAGALVDQDPAAAVRSAPVVVLPDAAAERLPDAILGWARSYVSHGGRLLVVYDAGTLDTTGSVRPEGLLEPLLGVRYSGYGGARNPPYATGEVSFADLAESTRWHMPPGKLMDGGVISSYIYGPLAYPLADARQSATGVNVAAHSGPIPVLATRRYGQGIAVWCALPLGLLQAYDSDSLPIEAVLQTVATDLAGLPRVLLAPGGEGGLVILWHVESNADYRPIRLMRRDGLLPPGVHQEFDITAGPYLDRPGDGEGFDACGKGRTLVKLLERRETVGSDGGWAHNMFARELADGKLTVAETRELVARNLDCLDRVTGQRIRDYTAPNGVFPQPEMTKILEQFGFDDYYYTGDTGAAPQLAFWDGKPVSSSVYSFPVMPDGRYASLADMAAAHVPGPAVEAWLRGVAEYVAANQTIRLVYSHPHDLAAPGYAVAFGRFLRVVDRLQRAGRLRTEPMHEFTEFLRREARTQISVRRTAAGYRLTLTNPLGLRQIAVAVPSTWRPEALGQVVTRDAGDGDRTYVIERDARQVVLRFTA